MKLFTEKQVEEMTKAACIAGQNNNAFIFWEVYKNITPIKLPSDGEIEDSKFPLNSPEQELYNDGWEEGAKWMRNKIQGGNK
jgi:hypothetical protein